MSEDLPKLECAACAEDGPCPLHDSTKIMLAQDPGPSLEVLYSGPPQLKECAHCRETDMRVMKVEGALRALSEKMYEASSLKEHAREMIAALVAGIPIKPTAPNEMKAAGAASLKDPTPYNKLSKEMMEKTFDLLEAPQKPKIHGTKQCPVCKGFGKTSKKYTCPMCMGKGRIDG